MSITDDDEQISRIVDELCSVIEFEHFLNTHDLEKLTDEEQNKLLELYERQRYSYGSSQAF